ncbi:hypothetical protein YYG_02109 [Plasmodium vinckei petteri]|uniref:Fam-b protein n=1 Tax=Plasmodium vinckei petteri TaxID=138298 RepID=W7AWY6_PLAVN|nr:hypothetical protein YYG_02109 [Plasmodium vinckei petteri]
MKGNILNFVFFSIIICFFGYGRNELYFINERSICLERNIINFRNNRILADAEKQFNLNNFYQSTWSLVNQLNDCNDDDEEITNLRNAIDSHIKNHKENNTLPNLNNLDGKTKKLIHKIQKELNEAKKELDNKSNCELEIQLMHDKRIIKKYENISVLEQKNFKQLENYENIFEIDEDKFDDKYNKIKSSNCYNKLKKNPEYKKSKKNLIIKVMLLITTFFVIIASGAMKFLLLLIPCAPFIFSNWRKVNKYHSEL